MLLPALNKARDRAHIANCTGNMKQLALSLSQYGNDNRDFLPSQGNPTQSWYPGGNAMFKRGTDFYTTYANREAKSSFCPTILGFMKGSGNLGYNIIGMSHDPNVSWGASDLWSTGYQYISCSRFSTSSNSMGYSDSYKVPREFSRRVIACDVMYVGTPISSYYGPTHCTQLAAAGGAAHQWGGAVSAFADGHAKWFLNPLGHIPVSWAQSQIISGNGWFFGHWTQRAYVPYGK